MCHQETIGEVVSSGGLQRLRYGPFMDVDVT